MPVINSKQKTPLYAVGAFVLILLGAWVWAWYNRFILDDALISFRYARHLAEGVGLVYNPGEYVEGYTNFLWTVWLAVSFFVNVDPIVFSWATGLLLFPLSLSLVCHLAYRLSGQWKTALLATGLTGFHFSYSAYATSGLETYLQSFLILFIIFLLLKWLRTHTLRLALAISVVSSLAFMTRMDSAVLLLPVYVALVWEIRQDQCHRRLAIILCAILPALIIVSVWLMWKVAYYGHILPNTFFAKTDGPRVVPGLYYILLYFVSYGLAPLIMVLLVLAWHRKVLRISRMRLEWLVLFGICAGWIAYLISIGGDFMEFRMMMPIAPLLFMFTAIAILTVFQRGSVKVAWIALLLVISGVHPQRSRLYGVETVVAMASDQQAGLWIEVGKALHDWFADTDIVIAVTPAGAIPFYAQLHTIDMLGLNDPWIARHGLPTENPDRRWLGEKPGHRIKAPMHYLVDQGVNLLIGHPLVRSPDGPRQYLEDYLGPRFHEFDQPPPLHTQVVEIPIATDRMLITLYLHTHPTIDRLIRTHQWRVYPLKSVEANL